VARQFWLPPPTCHILLFPSQWDRTGVYLFTYSYQNGPCYNRFRLDFLIIPHAFVTFSFCCLTVWRVLAPQRSRGRRVGDGCGRRHLAFPRLVLLVKQTALFFLLTPVLWVGVVAIRRQNWGAYSSWLGIVAVSGSVWSLGTAPMANYPDV